MSRPTLITGAAGFAGSHLVDLLTHDGLQVVAWARPGGTRAEGRGAAWQQVDLLDRKAVRRALEVTGPETIYHCAGAAHVGRSWNSTESTFAVNVRGTHHLLEGLRETALDARVLIPSSAMVYAGAERPLREEDPLIPASPYALSKLAQELVAADVPDGPQIVVARAFNHIGPRQSPHFAASGFARSIAEIEGGRRNDELEVGNLEARRDLTDVRDTVRAYRAIAERGVPGRSYNVCSGRAIAIRDLLDMLVSRARTPVRVKVDPTRYRPNDLPLVVGDPGRIRQELGWSAQIPLERTVNDLLDYWRAQLARSD
jgi:GDP-4-dehydro-6-deoxy-D-mannose reductase